MGFNARLSKVPQTLRIAQGAAARAATKATVATGCRAASKHT